MKNKEINNEEMTDERIKIKELITKLKNSGELASAAYGYYHLITNSTNQSYMIILKDEKGEVKSDANKKPVTKEVSLTDIMDSTYKNYEIYSPPPPSLPNLKPEKVGTLKGDFTPSQAKRFFGKYELLDYYPKDNSMGFHACLFGEKKLHHNKNTNESSYVGYTLAIRGSFDSNDYTTDFLNLFRDSTIPLK